MPKKNIKKTTEMVSIVIPSYNRRQELANCIGSLNAQEFDEALEVIVVDDGSTDGTDELIAGYPEIIYLKQENKGAAAARNKGVEAARGEFIFFLDSDCVVERDCLQELVKEISRDKKTAVVGCRIIGKTPGFFARCHDYAQYSGSMTLDREERKFLCSSGILVRKEIFEKMSGFDESFKIAEEEDLGLRIYEQGHKLIYQPKAIVYHFHGRNTFNKAILHGKRWAEAGSVKPYLKHSHSEYARFASANPYFYLLFSPFISLSVAGKIFLRIFSQDKKIIFYFPFVFFDKFFWCLGTFDYLSNENKSNSKI